MGLIKAAFSAASGTLADQWKEFFWCDAIPADTLAVRGVKKTSKKSSNHGNDNVITNGSGIAVADGQCMLIVDNGKVVDFCAEPGEYTYDASSEPSLLDGGKLADNIKAVFGTIGKRFTFGGDTAKDQRVYYFNTKELPGIKYGTQKPIPFRIVDARAGIDMDLSLRCFGEYSIKLTNPVLFYTNVCGNVEDAYKLENLDSMMKSELLTAMQPAFAKLSEMGLRYSQIPAHAEELSKLLNDELSAKWKDLRGMEIVSFGMNSLNVSEEDEKTLKELQRNMAFTDPARANAYLVGAAGAAMQDAAKNSNGAMAGFMGLNMAQGFGAQNIYAAGQVAAKSQWTCSCGAANSGNFCSNCGAKRPWTCSCGAVNTGNFCTSCGKKQGE